MFYCLDRVLHRPQHKRRFTIYGEGIWREGGAFGRQLSNWQLGCTSGKGQGHWQRGATAELWDRGHRSCDWREWVGSSSHRPWRESVWRDPWGVVRHTRQCGRFSRMFSLFSKKVSIWFSCRTVIKYSQVKYKSVYWSCRVSTAGTDNQL